VTCSSILRSSGNNGRVLMRSELFKLQADGSNHLCKTKIWTAHVTTQIPTGLVTSSKSQSVISNF
jgi:hypothetical protein